jgi:uncharacterized membrane-anchored protein
MRSALGLLLIWPFLSWGQADSSIASEMQKLAWQRGPTEGRIADKALVKVPEGYVFLDANNTSRFLELTGNPPRAANYLFAPSSLNWFAVFAFNPSGHVKDDEKIDADELLRSLKRSDSPENEERKRLGMEALYTDGWQVAPHYDADTKRLEWGTRLRTERGELIVNYSSRLLGRSGVMSAILVSDPDSLAADSQEFKSVLKNFSYVSGERYSEFKPGDKVAQYGLAALIVGGAAAVATKKGFWAVLMGFLGAFWKVIVGAGVAVLAGLGSLFKRNKA